MQLKIQWLLGYLSQRDLLFSTPKALSEPKNWIVYNYMFIKTHSSRAPSPQCRFYERGLWLIYDISKAPPFRRALLLPPHVYNSLTPFSMFDCWQSSRHIIPPLLLPHCDKLIRKPGCFLLGHQKEVQITWTQHIWESTHSSLIL